MYTRRLQERKVVTSKTDKPVILYIDTGPWFGGAQKSLSELTAELTDRFTPVVIGADNDGLGECCREAGIVFKHFPFTHWKKTIFGAMRYLYERIKSQSVIGEAVREFSPAVIHANTTRAALMLSPGMIPQVLHIRDSREVPTVKQIVCRKADTIIAVSDFIARQWKSEAQGKLCTVPNGIKTEHFNPSLPEGSAFADMQPYVLMVADFVPWKQHNLFVDAFAELTGEFPEVSAVIAGRANTKEGKAYRASVREAAETKLPGKMKIISTLNDVSELISGCSLLVSTATEEPFGRTVVEALACGKAVCAVNRGGPAEILVDCAAAFPAEFNTASLAAQIRKVLTTDSAMVQEAAIQRAERFNIQVTAKKTAAIYETLIKQSK